MGTPEFLEDCLYEEIPEKARKNVLLVERNDCTFTQKSINVQKEGGKLAIIIDNVVEQSESIIMKDDGKGHSVTIPTVLIGREDGLKMLEYIAQSPTITVSFELKVAQRSDVTLWLDVLDHKNYIFLRNFQSYFARIAPDSTPPPTQSTSASPTPPPAAATTATRIAVSTMGSTAGTRSASTLSRTRGKR
jgi:hypothetical protein